MEISWLFYEAYLYFSCYLQLCVMLVMWYLLFEALERFMVGYQEDRWEFRPYPALSRFTAWMVVWLVVCVLVFIWVSWCLQNYPLALRIVAAIPMIVYPALIVYLLWHHDLLGSFWKITLDSLCIWKPGGPSFKDGFVADIPTSLTKALSDFTYSWFRFLYGDKDVISGTCRGLWVDPTMCGDHYIAACIVMTLPYLIRLFQCLGEAWYKSPKKDHLMNATKYAAFILGLILSGLQTGALINHILYVAVVCIISGYATYMDILGDWQLHQSPSDSPNQHIVQNVHRLVFYLWVCPSDALLRFSWVYTCVVHPPHSSLAILLIAILEILRRYQWAYFCVERGARGYDVNEEDVVCSESTLLRSDPDLERGLLS